MRWAITILSCVVFTLMGLVALAQFLDRANPRFSKVPLSVRPPFELVITRYRRLPLRLSGPGGAPGEVAVVDDKGRILESERVQNVTSVGNVVWEDSDVTFMHVENGKVYETTFDLVR